MAATKDDIRRWFDNGKAAGATHMIVMCDTYDWDDYPVYVEPGQYATGPVHPRSRRGMLGPELMGSLLGRKARNRRRNND